MAVQRHLGDSKPLAQPLKLPQLIGFDEATGLRFDVQGRRTVGVHPVHTIPYGVCQFTMTWIVWAIIRTGTLRRDGALEHGQHGSGAGEGGVAGKGRHLRFAMISSHDGFGSIDTK